jgi:AraC-like DNA-binding protein
MWKTFKGEYITESHDLIFVKKGATSVYQYFDQEFSVLFIFVSDEFIKNVITKHGIRCRPIKSPSICDTDKVIILGSNDIFQAYFESLALYFQQPTPPGKALLITRLEELILNVISYGNNSELTQYFNEVCGNAALSMQYIMESNFQQNLSLAEFARLCAKSLSVFKRDFRSVYGSSPGKWLTEKRLEYSKYLLEVTNNDLEEVSHECGFANMSHFIRVFKERFGVTPLQFRKEHVP